MKRVSVLLAVVGVAVSTLLVTWYGADRVVDAVLSVGAGGFGAILLWQCVLMLVLGSGWASLLPEARWLAVWGRAVRDASGNLLPFSQVGGFVLGVRAVALHGLPWPRATASTLVDVTAEFLAQVVFAACGLVMLLERQPDSPLRWPLAIGLVLAVAGGAGFIWAQRGAGALFRRLLARAAGAMAGGAMAGGAAVGTDALEAELAVQYRHPWRLLRTLVLHFGGWVCSGVGSWISYRLLGASVDLWSALGIEALLSAALAVAFVVPGNAGVQEAAFAGIGSIFGLAPELSLGVSLLRRARDLATGIPILLAWQVLEARRLRGAGAARP